MVLNQTRPDALAPYQTLVSLAERYSISNRYLAGEPILREGEPGSTMLLIISGIVKIFMHSSIDDREILIGRRGDGEFLGEMALVEEMPRSASVVAETDCKVLEFSKQNFERIIQEQPTLATRVLASLSNKLRESDFFRVAELEERNRLLDESNRELIKFNAFLDCIIDQSPSAILLATRDGQIYRTNKAAISMFNLDESDSRVLLTELFEDSRLLQFLNNSQGVWHGEVTAIRDSQQFTAYVSVSSLTGQNNSALNLLICQDITELHVFNKTVTELERYESAQELAIELAHDLKNMLGVLIGNMELIISRLDSQQRKRSNRAIQAIEKSSQETLEFIEELMAYREDKKKWSQTDLRAMIRAIVRFCQAQGKFRDIDLQLTIAPSFPTSLLIKEGQIQSAIVNLLVNAAEALSRCSEQAVKKITIQLDSRQQSAEISVSDNGPGIPTYNISKMFKQRFTTKEGGHGIGLVSIHKIMQKHGGEVDVTSVLGKGTTFVIRLPLSFEVENA